MLCSFVPKVRTLPPRSLLMMAICRPGQKRMTSDNSQTPESRRPINVRSLATTQKMLAWIRLGPFRPTRPVIFLTLLVLYKVRDRLTWRRPRYLTYRMESPRQKMGIRHAWSIKFAASALSKESYSKRSNLPAATEPLTSSLFFSSSFVICRKGYARLRFDDRSEKYYGIHSWQV